MTDHKDSPEAILGELESIKDLLSEDELAAIPTLENTVTAPPLQRQKTALRKSLKLPPQTQTQKQPLRIFLKLRTFLC